MLIIRNRNWYILVRLLSRKKLDQLVSKVLASRESIACFHVLIWYYTTEKLAVSEENFKIIKQIQGHKSWLAVFNRGYGRVIEVNSPLITNLSPNMARMRIAGILLFLRVFFLGKYLTSNLQLDQFWHHRAKNEIWGALLLHWWSQLEFVVTVWITHLFENVLMS